MVEKIYKIDIHNSAYNDLENIKKYWELVLETSADTFMAEIYQKAKSLETFPFAHHQPRDKYLREKGYRICPVRNYYIFYTVNEDTVQIHRVLYNKMDFSKLF